MFPRQHPRWQREEIIGASAEFALKSSVSSADALAVDAADLMEQHRITSVLVVDAQGLLAGALNSNDLKRAKVI